MTVHPQMSTVQAAQHRASITAWLNGNPGWHPTAEIATALGLGTITTGQLLRGMAANKLIDGPGKAGTKKTWRSLESARQDTANEFSSARQSVPPLYRALLGAERVLNHGTRQREVAKEMAVNLNLLNKCVQLLKLNSDTAAQLVQRVRDEPAMTVVDFDRALAEVGIAEPRKLQSGAAPKEIELQIAGCLIVIDPSACGSVNIGRNETTGRLRITLEGSQ